VVGSFPQRDQPWAVALYPASGLLYVAYGTGNTVAAFNTIVR
jgi:DNA-binding beta-propeller fold protein YncE